MDEENPSPSNGGASPPVRTERRSAVAALLLGAALLGLFAFQLWLHATRTSPTLDEPYHILAGYRYWECGDFGVNAEHPPLLKLVAAWPIHTWGLAGPPWPCGSRMTPLPEGFQAGTRFVLENGIDRIVVPARLASSLFALALAALVALAALEMFGRAEALAALALVAFEPNLVAHGSLVTTDMALAAGVFASAYALYRYGKRPSLGRLLVAGLAVGVALAAKHSAIVIVPVLCALPVLDAAIAARASTTGRAGLLRRAAVRACAGAAAALVGLAVLWACYGFRYDALPGGASTTVTVATIVGASANPLAAESAAGRLAGLLERARLVPEAYAQGLAYVAAYDTRPTYLLGAHFPTGQWFYFPIAFLIKTSIPLLALLAAALASRALFRSHPRELLVLLLPPVVYFAAAMTSGANIGVRHVLPVYPFFAVIAAAGACSWARRSRSELWVVVALLAFHAITAARTAPDYIAFANDAWGGTGNSYRLLHDSNVDWGQNLESVAAYLDREGAGECWLASYGNGELASAIVPQCRLLPALGWANQDRLVDPAPPVIDGTVLLSASVLTDPAAAAAYAPITATGPVDVIGGGILVYRGRFEAPVVAALSHLDRAEQLIRQGRSAEAVVDARRAAALARADATVHLGAGSILARAGAYAEARRELESAIGLARSRPDAFGPAGREAQRVLDGLPTIQGPLPPAP